MNRLVPIATATALSVAALLMWGGDRVLPGQLADTLLPPQVRQDSPREGVFTSDRVVRLEGDRTLLMSYTGAPPGPPPCGSNPVLLADETGPDVVLRVQEQAEPSSPPSPPNEDGVIYACTAVGSFRTLSVELTEALGHRRVLDDAGLDMGPVVLPLPTVLPDGYRPGVEAGSPESYGISYVSAVGGWLTLIAWFSEPPDKQLEAFDRTDGSEVDGEPAQLMTMGGQQRVLAWRHEGRLLWLSSTGSAEDPPLAADVLLDVARSVR